MNLALTELFQVQLHMVIYYPHIVYSISGSEAKEPNANAIFIDLIQALKCEMWI